MSTKIEVELSAEGMRELAERLKKYSDDFNAKVPEYVVELAKTGQRVAERNKGDSHPEKIQFKSELKKKTKYKATATMSGYSGTVYQEWYIGKSKKNTHGYDINPLLLAEYGSGNSAIEGHRNTMPNNYGNIDKKKIPWSYRPVAMPDVRIYSSGVSPSRPMHKAGIEIRNNVVSVAQKVFTS